MNPRLIMLGLGIAVGYVLGTRDGRERYDAMKAKVTGRRPSASDSGPATSWAQAKPPKYRVSVSLTRRLPGASSRGFGVSKSRAGPVSPGPYAQIR